MEAHLTLHGWEPAGFATAWRGVWHADKGLVFLSLNDPTQGVVISPTWSRGEGEEHIINQCRCAFSDIDNDTLTAIVTFLENIT